MDIRHLRYFLAVAEELHFTRAAQRLHMAQPPLSARIKDLESELGEALFLRSRPGVSLTEAGRALLPLAQKAVDAFDDVLRYTDDRLAQPGVVRVAITPDTTPAAIEMFMETVRGMHPSINLEVVEAHTTQQLEQIRLGHVDLGLLRHPFPTAGLVVRPPLSTPVGALMAASHPLAQTTTVHPADLAPYPIVLFPREIAPGHYDEILAALTTHGLQRATLRHATRILHALLTTEDAIALRNQGTVYRSDDAHDLVWRPIGNNFLHWYTSVAWSTTTRHRTVPSCAEALVEALVEHDQWVDENSTEGH